MARKISGKKRPAIIALIAVMAFVGAPQAASAETVEVNAPVVVSFFSGDLASWAEEASWAES
jgi:hypothetical protein